MTLSGSPWSDRVIDRIARMAGAVGMNEVRVRWKLLNARERWREGQRRTEVVVAHARIDSRNCPRCRALQGGSAKTCSNCGARLGWRGWDKLRRLGFVLPTSATISVLLAVAIVIAYARTIVAEPSHNPLAFSIQTLLTLGGHYPPLVHAGEWWRVLTCVLLHGGILHVLFNLMALSQVGPAIENLYGRSFLLAAFVVTGVAGSYGSALLGLRGVSIGASGAIMGLCGLAAGWGQRDGTSIGHEIRNQMLKWAAYTMLFGLFLRADNGAHAAGFVSGGALGLLVPARWMKDRAPSSVKVLLAAFGAIALLGALGLVLFPPVSPYL